jgi:hypothetical protein
MRVLAAAVVLALAVPLAAERDARDALGLDSVVRADVPRQVPPAP